MTSERACVTVYRQPDGLWRWRWSAGEDGGATLTSSHAASSCEEAESQAREAYPTTTVVVADAPQQPGERRHRRLAGLLRLGSVAVLALLVVRAARGHRRGRP